MNPTRCSITQGIYHVVSSLAAITVLIASEAFWRFPVVLLAFCGVLISQTAINIGGTQYAVKPDPVVWLDGAGGPLTLASQDASGTGRANTANLPFAAMKANCDSFIAAGYTNPYADSSGTGSMYGRFAGCAMVWWALGANASDPSGYAAAARYGLLHLENFAGGTFGCDTTTAYCSGRSSDIDYLRMGVPGVAQAYSVLSAGGMLSSGDKATIEAKLLNDNTTAHNGIDSAACTNPGTPTGIGTLTASASTTVTISGGNTSQLAPGGVILSTGNVELAVVTSIIDSTHFVLNQAVTWAGIAFHYGRPWQSGDCGYIYLAKHHNSAPPITPGEESAYSTDYYNGNSFVAANENLTFTALVAYISVGLALAKDDTRAALLAQESINYYLQHQYAYALSSYTGFTSAGAAYTNDRTGWMLQMVAAMIKNSLVSGPDIYTGKQYSKLLLPYAYYTALPDNPVDMLTFQDIYASKPNVHPLILGLGLQPSIPEAGYANYWMRTVRNDWTAAGLGQSTNCANSLCNYLPWEYVFADPALTQTNISTAPSQYLFADADYTACQSAGYTCYANAAMSHAISRSGWTANDDVVLSQFSYIYPANNDHSGGGNWGAVHIYRKGYLLAGDAQYGNNNLALDSMISVGSDANWAGGFGTPYRWAGTHPTGVSDSSYAYTLMDITADYKAAANVTRAQRSLIHFKGTGQDYVVWYDDVATSTGNIKKAYLHFYHADCYAAARCSDGASGITWGGGNNGGTVVNTATSSRLQASILPVNGTNTVLLGYDNVDGSYTGGTGHTFRAYACAENASSPGTCDAKATAGEWLAVFQPSTNTSDTLPTLKQPSCTAAGGNCATLEIQDATHPKVAAFARQGALVSAMAFITTHSGTAQYVIAGLAPGRYSITVDGSVVANNTVMGGDTSLSFFSSSGAVSISLAGLPSAVSATPASGNGGAQTFALLFSDTRGYAALGTVSIIINSNLNGSTGCYLYYLQASNAVYLANDAGTAWQGPVTPGHSGTLQNSQCAVNPAASSVSVSGNNLTLNLGLTFQASFNGAKNIYMMAYDGQNSGWLQKGVWTVNAAFPMGPAAVSPASGSGSSQTFSFLFADPQGASSISSVSMIFGASVTGAGTCYLYYLQASNAVYLANDAGTAWQGPVTPGHSGTLQNSQCAVNPAASSVSVSGNNLTLNLGLTFQASFNGAKNIYMMAYDGQNSGWLQKGVWTVNAAFPMGPAAVSPASGSGSSQTFSFLFADPQGASSISSVSMIFGASVTGAGTCYLYYLQASNAVYLANDAGTAWQGPVTPGHSGTLQNSQCAVNPAASSVSVSGNNLTLNLGLTFQASFNGAKNIYMMAYDGQNSGWLQKGVWTVNAAFPMGPAAVSPASGSGSSQTFSFLFADPQGASSISSVSMIFGASVTGAGTCYLYYLQASNAVYLANDAGTAWQGPVTPGHSGTLQNSQCAVNPAASSVSVSGNNLTLNLGLTFQASFNGAKNVYMMAYDGQNSGWLQKGVWTVNAAFPMGPAAVSPASGSGSSQTFSFLFADPQGASSISSVSMIFGASVTGAGTCYLYYLQASNAVYLANDAGTAWQGPVTPGHSGTLQNSQCAVNPAASSVSVSGNNLTLNLGLTFQASFNGAKNIYMMAYDGQNSGWLQKGVWTP